VTARLLRREGGADGTVVAEGALRWLLHLCVELLERVLELLLRVDGDGVANRCRGDERWSGAVARCIFSSCCSGAGRCYVWFDLRR